MTSSFLPQISFDLAPAPDFSLEAFHVGESNAAAYKAVTAWPDWPSPILLLIGPKGSGKTHLGQGWVAAHNGKVLVNSDASVFDEHTNQCVFIDEAETLSEDDLFAYMNLALSAHIPGLLIAARKAPQFWSTKLPDLRSRLINTPRAILDDADDMILESIIRKLFEDQGRSVKSDVVAYLIRHESRSIAAMRKLILDIEFAARAAKRDVTKAFVSSHLRRV